MPSRGGSEDADVQDRCIRAGFGVAWHLLLDDAWQNQYFGLDNPLAAPTADPDGETNSFEFTAGLIPSDPQSLSPSPP